MKCQNLLDIYRKSDNWSCLSNETKSLYENGFKRLSKWLGTVEVEVLTEPDRLAAYLDFLTKNGVTDPTLGTLDLALLRSAADYSELELPSPSAVAMAFRDLKRPAKSPRARRFEKVVVKPGDWGGKFRPFEGAYRANNREIAPRHARALLDKWDSVVAESTLVLTEDVRTGAFLIVDGQHRVYAASELREKPTTFYAEVRSVDQMPSDPAAQIANLNMTRRFRSVDFLQSQKDHSLWPKLLEERGLTPSYGGATGRNLTWMAVLMGVAYARNHRNNVAQTTGTNAEGMLELWLSHDPEVLEEMKVVADVLNWWLPGSKIAEARGVKAMRSSMGIAFALLLVDKNQGNRLLDSAPQRIATWPPLESVKGLTAARGQDLWKQLAIAMNYRQREPVLIF